MLVLMFYCVSMESLMFGPWKNLKRSSASHSTSWGKRSSDLDAIFTSSYLGRAFRKFAMDLERSCKERKKYIGNNKKQQKNEV